MADQRISQLNELGQGSLAASDLIPIVDSSSSETKKITAKSLFQGAAALADTSSIDLAKLDQSSATKLAAAAIADDAITAAKLANDSSINYGPTEPSTDNFEGRGHVNSTTKYLKVYDGSVYQQVIAPAAGIEDLAVTTGKLAANAVTTAKIDASGLAAAALATDSVTTAKIQALAITEAKLAAGSVTATKIGTSAIVAEKIATDAITTASIIALNVTEAKIATGAVTETKIGTGAVTVNKIADTSITYAKLNVTDNVFPGAKLVDGSVVAAKLATDSVSTAKIIDLTVTTGKLAANAVTTAKIATGAVTETEIATGAVTTAKIATDAITYAKIQNVSATDKILGRVTAGTGDIEEITCTAAGRALLDDANAAAQRTTLELGTLATQSGTFSGTHSDTSSGTNTGDQTITLTGDVNGTGTGSFATTIAESAVTTAKLPNSAITTAKIADDAVTAAKLADQSATVIAAVSPNVNGVFTGQQWFNTVTKLQYMWDGSAWNQSAGFINSLAFSDTTPLTFSAATDAAGVATITSGLDTQTAATVFSGPTTGSAAAPTFRALVATDLPVAGASTNGAVQPGTGLSVTGGGVLNHTTSATAGTYTKVTIDAQGHVSAGTTLSAADIPNLAASKITTGTFAANLIGTSTITGEKLANSSTIKFGGSGSTSGVVEFPTADFQGQLFWDELNSDLYIWNGSAWLSVTVTSGELVFAGIYNATTNLMTAVSAAGLGLGLTVGGVLPASSETNKQYYVVIGTTGTGTAPAPAVALQPPDFLISTGTAWTLVDVSTTVAAANNATGIVFTPAGDIVATNVQTAIQELDTEKLSKTGGTVTGNLEIGTTGSLTFEGSSADAYESTIAVVNPTADRTITLPDATGTVVLSGAIVNADINASAAIADTKLATIATAAKVSNSATTATNANTASTIVARDASGNFIAGTITANLTGTASLATSAAACTGNAATVTTNANLTGDVTSVGNATAIAAGVIINADINASAAIVDTKLAQITTAGKVSGTAITTGNISTSGSITTTSTLSVQSITIGKGAGAISTNTAVGNNALNSNTTGFNNTAIGAGSLQANTLGDGNTAVGLDALNDNTSGIANTAIGRESLRININGDNNTAVGIQSMYFNTAGDDNTAIGINALYYNTSNDNTALGAYTLQENTTGISNVAVGRAALFAKITGNENTAIGTNALVANTAGSNNVGIGYNVSSSTLTISNEVNISNGSVIARFQGAASAWTFVSDVRDKNNIQDLTLGLDFITALKPRKFNWNMRDSKVDKGKPAAGFIAQEVLETVERFNAPYTNLISTNDPNQYTFAQANMIPMLVKAIQELTAKVEALEARC